MATEDPGTHCKCGRAFEERPNQFHWRGRSFSGLVCSECNSLWNNPRDSFLAHVSSREWPPLDDGSYDVPALAIQASVELGIHASEPRGATGFFGATPIGITSIEELIQSWEKRAANVDLGGYDAREAYEECARELRALMNLKRD